MESRNNKKRCMGRVTKNLADLTLQSGLLGDSLSMYHSSAEILKSVNDWLWLAAAKEGMYFKCYYCHRLICFIIINSLE